MPTTPPIDADTTDITTRGRRLRAIGVVRVSQVGARDEDRLASPEQQTDVVTAVCRRERWDLISVLPEINVSGGDPLEMRTGLRHAVEAIEAGRADVVVVAYFDRMFRSLDVQRSVQARVREAGGRLETADLGEIRSDTATDRLRANLHGAITEYQREYLVERVKGAQKIAVENGRVPMRLIPGLRRLEDGTVDIDADKADAVRMAFQMRRDDATIEVVRTYLREQGIELSYHGVSCLLKSKLAVGEYEFGELRGECPAIVDRELFDAVQKKVIPRGRKPKSMRLLSRLGILRCAACDARMVIGGQTKRASGKSYPFYRCPPTGGCTERANIGAGIIEGLVVDEVKRLLAGVREEASADVGVAAALAELDQKQAALDGAVEAFTGLGDVASVGEKLRALRAERDEAQASYERLAAVDDATTLAIGVEDWDVLTLDEQRGLISAVIERVSVARGRDLDRVRIEPRV